MGELTLFLVYRLIATITSKRNTQICGHNQHLPIIHQHYFFSPVLRLSHGISRPQPNHKSWQKFKNHPFQPQFCLSCKRSESHWIRRQISYLYCKGGNTFPVLFLSSLAESCYSIRHLFCFGEGSLIAILHDLPPTSKKFLSSVRKCFGIYLCIKKTL